MCALRRRPTWVGPKLLLAKHFRDAQVQPNEFQMEANRATKQQQQQQKRSPVQGSKGSALTQPSCCGMLHKSETETEAERERASESKGVMAKKRTMLVQNGRERGRRGTAQVTMTMTTLPRLASPRPNNAPTTCATFFPRCCRSHCPAPHAKPQRWRWHYFFLSFLGFNCSRTGESY